METETPRQSTVLAMARVRLLLASEKEASDGSAEQINCCSSLGVSRTPPACLQQSRGGSSRKDMQMTVCAHASSDKGEVYNDGVTVSCVEI